MTDNTSDTSQPLPLAGWYPDPTGAPGQRYFDGTGWTGHYALSRQERADRLDVAVTSAVARGARLESRTATSAVLVYGSTPNHVAHLLGVILTCGLWMIGWLIFITVQSEWRQILTVDSYGRVAETAP